MLIAVEAEIDTNGVVTLLEPVTVTRKTRAVVTLLEEKAEESKSSAAAEQPDNALVRWLNTKDDDPNAKFPAKIIAADLPVRDLSLEYEWLAANRDEYDGKYVALDGNTLVAVGDSYKEAAVKARELGVNNVLIVFVEGSNRPKFISGGLWRE